MMMGRRCQQRWEIRVAGCYRSPAGAEMFVSVTDISQLGCRVANPSRNLFIGDRVTMFVDGLDPHEAEVRWLDRGVEAGFRFMEPVDDEQLHLLIAHCAGRVKLAPPQWRDDAESERAR